LFLKISVAVFIFMNIFYLMAIIKKKYSVIDIGWGLGFILIALVSYFHHPMSVKNAVLLLVVTAWGLRLGVHILIRSKGQPEDPRYTKMRNEWGDHANGQAYFKIFLMQGLFMMIVSLPISVGMIQEDHSLMWFNYAGLIIWLTGFALEIWSDFYLEWFLKQPANKGKLCTTGPWRICRYPNYLGEISLWYGVYLLALGGLSWWTIVGPVLLNLLILKVSGVSLGEERKKKKPEYAAYARQTPRLLPFKTRGNTTPP
jgi:steroid 5-alpha reductase family enzyme